MSDLTIKDMEKLAKKHIVGLETLETRNSDSLDFHDIAVWCLVDLIEAAYEAGKKAGQNNAK